MVWDSFPLACGVYPPKADSRPVALPEGRTILRVFGVCTGLEVTPLARTVLYPPQEPTEAIPRYISGRTSYHQARLAFHSYPQVIRGFFTIHRFGPPLGVTPASPCPGVARLASGLPMPTERPIRTRFPCGSAPAGLSLADTGNSRAHVAKGTPPPRPKARL